METHYDTLGVDRSASADEVRKAYRAALRRLHPDVTGVAADTSRISDVHLAYDILSNPDTRASYDRGLDREEAERFVTEEPAQTQWYPATPHEPAPVFVEHDDRPLGFADYYDHPINRRKIIAGAVSLALGISGCVTYTIIAPEKVLIGALGMGLFYILAVFSKRSAFKLGAVSLALGFFTSLIIMNSVLFLLTLLVVVSIPLANIGAVTTLAILSEIHADRMSRISREKQERERMRRETRERRYQDRANERRARREARRRRE